MVTAYDFRRGTAIQKWQGTLTHTAVSHHPQNLVIAACKNNFSAHNTANTERTTKDINVMTSK